MSTDNFGIEFDRFKQQLEKDEHELKEAQEKLRATKAEIQNLRTVIEESKKKLVKDESEERELLRKVGKLEADQIRHHADVERLSRANRERLEHSGVKDIKPKYF